MRGSGEHTAGTVAWRHGVFDEQPLIEGAANAIPSKETCHDQGTANL